VSKWIPNGTSAQLGYTVSFMLVHAGKYRTEDNNTDSSETIHAVPRKANNANTANKTTLFQSLFTVITIFGTTCAVIESHKFE